MINPSGYMIGKVVSLAYFVTIYLSAAVPVLCKYKGKRFEDNAFFFNHQRWWWAVGLLPIFLLWLRTLTPLNIHLPHESSLNFNLSYDYDDANPYTRELYWQLTALWILFMLTVSSGLAIHQNQQKISWYYLLLCIADCVGLGYLVFYFSASDPETEPLLIPALAVTLPVISLFVIFLPIKQIKKAAKNMLFAFSCLLILFMPLVLLRILCWVLYEGYVHY